VPKNEKNQAAKAVKRGAGRRFPYKARNAAEQGAINQKISDVLISVDDMLYRMARRRAGVGLDDQAIQEIVQRCRSWLWQKSLPKFDAWRERKAKVSTFIFRCARNFVNQEVRSLVRARESPKRIHNIDPELLVHVVQGSDLAFDRKIEVVSRHVHKNPEAYFTPVQCQVFKAVTENPGVPMKELARRLGYQRASSLSMIMRRIRERVMEIDVEDFEFDGNEHTRAWDEDK
jgi:DNA-directed RNA polymerase specialized sigma24 family protein